MLMWYNCMCLLQVLTSWPHGHLLQLLWFSHRQRQSLCHGRYLPPEIQEWSHWSCWRSVHLWRHQSTCNWLRTRHQTCWQRCSLRRQCRTLEVLATKVRPVTASSHRPVACQPPSQHCNTCPRLNPPLHNPFAANAPPTQLVMASRSRQRLLSPCEPPSDRQPNQPSSAKQNPKKKH